MRGKSSLKVEIEGNRHEIRGREGAIIPYEIERGYYWRYPPFYLALLIQLGQHAIHQSGQTFGFYKNLSGYHIASHRMLQRHYSACTGCSRVLESITLIHQPRQSVIAVVLTNSLGLNSCLTDRLRASSYIKSRFQISSEASVIYHIVVHRERKIVPRGDRRLTVRLG